MAGAAAAAVVVLLAGAPAITEADLSEYQATQACYGEGPLSGRRAAFMRLLEAAVAEKAMEADGAPAISAADLQREAKRIDEQTRAPEILECVKRVFGGRRERYLRVFVRPRLAETRLRKFLDEADAVQGEPRGRARAAAQEVRGGASLCEAAASAGLAYSSGTISDDALQGGPGAREPQFMAQQLDGLTTGQAEPALRESPVDVRLTRLVRVEGSSRTFETAWAAKISQKDWFASRPKLEAVVYDAELYSWASSIRGNPRLAAVVLTAPNMTKKQSK